MFLGSLEVGAGDSAMDKEIDILLHSLTEMNDKDLSTLKDAGKNFTQEKYTTLATARTVFITYCFVMIRLENYEM